jgi:hypothetical protein
MSAETALDEIKYVDQHRYRVDASLTFEREPNGTVKVIAQGQTFTIPDNLWASLVLTMTEFSERPGDWQTFMDHHHGRKDMLEGNRGGY